METANLLFNAENVRMLVILAFGFCAYVLNKGQMKDLKSDMLEMKIEFMRAMDEKIDTKLGNFHSQLKDNDFAHLNATIEALTFTLEKNKFLSSEDKAYIDGRLDR